MQSRIKRHLVSQIAFAALLLLVATVTFTNGAKLTNKQLAPVPYYIGQFQNRLAELAKRATIQSTTTSAFIASVPIVDTFFKSSDALLPSDTQNDNSSGYVFWDYYRTKVGLDPYAIDPLLEKSAAAHAGYVVANNSYAVEGHYETAGNAGFTGVGPCDREKAAGYLDICIGEEGNANRFASQDVVGLIDAPYHRLYMLANFFTSAGLGTAGKPAFFIDLGGYKVSDATESRLVVYPFPEQKDAPRGWSNLESPSPMPDVPAGTIVGYPISITSRLRGSLDISDFKLRAPDGSLVEGRPVIDFEDTRSSLGNGFIWIPKAPLAASTTFSAEAVGALDGTPVVLNWSFSTQPVNNFALVASSPSISKNSIVTVRVTSPVPFSVSPGFRAFPGARITMKSPTTFEIARNDVSCTGCYVSISMSDANLSDAPQLLILPYSD